MKRNNFSRILAVVLAVITLCALSLPALAAYPKADGYVADEAGVLSESTVRQIKKTNETLKKDVGITIAVCTVKTTDGTPIADYARGLYTEWKLGEGVLLLIASDDKNYYLVQSTGLEAHLTNAELEAIRDGYLEDDFAAGNIDSGVLKAFSKLNAELEDGVKFPVVEDVPVDDNGEEREENKGTSLGSAIVTILKVILYIALFALALFVILFVVAMFNDDVAALLQRYVFRKGKTNPAQHNYYDDRLYGNGNRRPTQQQPQQRPQGQRPQGQAPQQRRNPNQMYNADGTPRRQQNNGGQNNRGGYGY